MRAFTILIVSVGLLVGILLLYNNNRALPVATHTKQLSEEIKKSGCMLELRKWLKDNGANYDYSDGDIILQKSQWPSCLNALSPEEVRLLAKPKGIHLGWGSGIYTNYGVRIYLEKSPDMKDVDGYIFDNQYRVPIDETAYVYAVVDEATARRLNKDLIQK